MQDIKHLLSLKTKFLWIKEIDEEFERSKELIAQEIIEGVEIFDPFRPTCLRPSG